MDQAAEGTHEPFIPSAQEKTAQRTRNLLVAARLAFTFSHGALVVTASVQLGWEGDASWWTVFLPAWLGNATCFVLIILSWFASCPYIQLCLNERQARLGDCNPSILTEILPDIVMAILGLLFLVLALTAEIMLCGYLDRRHYGESQNSLWPSAVVFIIVSTCACCRGICISTSSELFSFFGGAVLLSFVAALSVPGGLDGHSSWVVALPSLLAASAMLVVNVRRLRGCSVVLQREERILRIVEQFILFLAMVALTVLVLLLAFCGRGDTHNLAIQCGAARGGAAAAAGGGVCILAMLRARMAMVESRLGPVNERMISWKAAGSHPRGQAHAHNGVNADAPFSTGGTSNASPLSTGGTAATGSPDLRVQYGNE